MDGPSPSRRGIQQALAHTDKSTNNENERKSHILQLHGHLDTWETSDLTTVFGYNTISLRSGTNKLRCWRAGTTAGLTNYSTTRGKRTTMADDSYGPYTQGNFRMRPQSIGAIQRRQKNSLTQPWKPRSNLTVPFCPATNKQPHLRKRMSMSTIGLSPTL